jgi:oxaloacetate decarboxylase alpha subunit
MKDYIKGLYGRAPGPMDPDIVGRVLGDLKPLADDVRPGSLVTTTYDEMAAEIGDLARSEEDVLMYALFPNEARQYLTKHLKGAEGAVFMMGQESDKSREEGDVDVGQIRELVKMVEGSDVSEIVIEEGDVRIVVRKGGHSESGEAQVSTSTAATAARAPVAGGVDGAPAAEGDRPVTWIPVVAPMVGTFYASPSPGAAAFVAVGDAVTEGQPLCILEAMKLMNEIAAEEAGIVREVCVPDASPVEYGTALFYLEPSA